MATKKRFKQAEYDKLITNRARAILSLRKARRELEAYLKTHKSR